MRTAGLAGKVMKLAVDTFSLRHLLAFLEENLKVSLGIIFL